MLVAAVIAAAAFAVLWQGAVTGITTVRAASADQTAIALARSHLALLGRDISAWPQDMQGRDGDYDWRVHVARQTAASPGARMIDLAQNLAEPRPTLYAIDVAVSWMSGGRSRALHLDAQRLGFAPPQSIAP